MPGEGPGNGILHLDFESSQTHGRTWVAVQAEGRKLHLRVSAR